MICVFARKITSQLAGLVKQIDNAIAKDESRKLAAFVVLLSGDSDASERSLSEFAKTCGVHHVPLTIYAGIAGPVNYTVDKDAQITVMMWSGEKKLVRVNHSIGNGPVDENLVSKVVADASTNEQGRTASYGVFNRRISVDQLKKIGTRTEIASLDLQDVHLTASGIRHLHSLTRLRSLNLFRNKRLTDDAVDTLIQFSQLEELNISSTLITNDGLARLASELTRLTKLNFRNSRQIDDDGLEQLLQRPQLKVLLCGNTSITDAGLAHISKLESLQELEVRKTKITSDGLAHLRKLTTLQNLNCSDNNLTSAAVQHLVGLQNLQTLDLSQTRIDDSALAVLAKLNKLEALDLSKTRITDDGLRHLHRIKALKYVNLFATQTTEAEIEKLRRTRPNCEVLH